MSEDHGVDDVDPRVARALGYQAASLDDADGVTLSVYDALTQELERIGRSVERRERTPFDAGVLAWRVAHAAIGGEAQGLRAWIARTTEQQVRLRNDPLWSRFLRLGREGAGLEAIEYHSPREFAEKRERLTVELGDELARIKSDDRPSSE